MESRAMLAQTKVRLDVDPLKDIALAVEPAQETAEEVTAGLFNLWVDVSSDVEKLYNQGVRAFFQKLLNSILKKMNAEDVLVKKAAITKKIGEIASEVRICGADSTHVPYELGQHGKLVMRGRGPQ
jgi:hypothetical protein